MCKIINTLILISIVLILLTSVNGKIYSSHFFILFDICKNDSVIIKEYGMRTREVIYEEEGEGDYSIVFLSTYDKTLFTYNFNVQFIIHAEGIDPITGEMKYIEVNLDCTERYFRFPYFENMKKVRILHLDKLIHEIEICNYNKKCEENLGENSNNCMDCNICGNKICEPFENYTNCCIDCGCPEGLLCRGNVCIEERCGNKICESFPPYNENYNKCPKDCPSGSKDNYCDGVVDGICDPDCTEKTDPDCYKPNYSMVFIIIVIIFLSLIAFYYLWSKFKR
mgnify:CR=1 FL=1